MPSVFNLNGAYCVKCNNFLECTTGTFCANRNRFDIII